MKKEITIVITMQRAILATLVGLTLALGAHCYGLHKREAQHRKTIIRLVDQLDKAERTNEVQEAGEAPTASEPIEYKNPYNK